MNDDNRGKAALNREVLIWMGLLMLTGVMVLTKVIRNRWVGFGLVMILAGVQLTMVYRELPLGRGDGFFKVLLVTAAVILAGALGLAFLAGGPR